METVGSFEAKTHLSRIIDRVEEGQEVIISRAGKPVAKVVTAWLAGSTRSNRPWGAVPSAKSTT